MIILLKASESYNCINVEENAAKAFILYTTAINFDHFENSKKSCWICQCIAIVSHTLSSVV